VLEYYLGSDFGKKRPKGEVIAHASRFSKLDYISAG